MHRADCTDAHRRHWEDAELLFAHARWANADQLYGYSAECGLQLVMESLGMAVAPADRQRKMPVQELWPELVASSAGRQGARYLALLPPGAPFAHWSHHDRYAHWGRFGEEQAMRHRQAANEVRELVDFALEDGSQ